MLKKIVISLTLLLWPLNLYLANSSRDFVSYLIPAILIGISYFLWKKYPKYYLLPILLIGLFEKKLIILPILFSLFEIISKFTKRTFVFLIISLCVFLWGFSNYKGQTVFNRDYEAEQLILRNIHIYPNVFTARLFQNKSKIYLNKISNNFFSLTDLNNYFFASHPAQTIVDNQNLYKYPFVAIIFLLFGIYYIKNDPNKKFVLFSLLSSLIALVVLNNFDRNDFILWVPISLVMLRGIGEIYQKHKILWLIVSVIFIIFAVPEYTRGFVGKYYK